MPVKDALQTFAKSVQREAKENLKDKDKDDTGALINSVTFDLQVHKRSFHLSFGLTKYALFVDKGVRGTRSAARAPKSPFRYGTGTGEKGGLTTAIFGWTIRKRIQFKDKATGRFMSYKNTAWVITKSIYSKGLRTTNFFTSPFEKAFEKLPDDLTEAYGLDLDNLFKRVFK